MALYKDTYKCRKCGQTFTWYYQPAQEDGYGYRPKSSSEETVSYTHLDVYKRQGYYGRSGKIRKSDPSLQPGAALPAAFTGCGRRLFDLPLENEDIL